MYLKANEEIIKRHSPDWVQWHDHCKKQVLEAMAEKDKGIINWHELSRKLSGNGQNIRPNKIPKKYQRKVNRLLWILDLWDRWANRV